MSSILVPLKRGEDFAMLTAASTFIFISCAETEQMPKSIINNKDCIFISNELIVFTKVGNILTNEYIF